jgi:magnesium transporter
MSKRNKNQIKQKLVSKKGQPPGSSIYVGEDRDTKARINVISYTLQESKEYNDVSIAFLNELDPSTYHWVIIVGVHDVNLVHSVCNKFKIHALTEEDILNTISRPKCEVYDEYIYSGLKNIKNENPDIIIEEEQVSLVLTRNVLLSFQEMECGVFDVIKKRLENPDSRARRKKTDYLFFLLHDVIVDNYLYIIDIADDTNSNLEKDILVHQNQEVLNRIIALKSDLLYLKRIIFPVKESIAKLMREDGTHIEKENQIYFNDIFDHLMHVTENIETQREIIASHRDLYMSMTDISMNNVMKVLTIVTSVFIPLTFIVGVYGMNFENMPELRMKNGYFITLGVMLFLAIIMVYYFKRKKWL